MNPRRGFGRRPGAWLIVPLAAAMAATAIDAALLQRARAYFTGGFLAADSARTLTDAAGFLLGSLASDFGTVGVFALLLLWLMGRWGVPVPVASVLAVGASLVPMAVTNFAEYELAAYLGDAFDLRLMFELAGGDGREFLAVGWSHLASIALVAAPLLALAVWAGLAVRRRLSAGRPWPSHPSLAAVLVRASAFVLMAAVATAGLRGSSDVLDNGLRRKPSGQWLGALVNAASDVDRDGFGILGRPPDPALFDARVRPYAVEVPANGIDEDGAAGDLPSLEPAYREASPVTGRWLRQTDVVLVVLESFRFDAVGSRFGGRPVTPVLDELARRGVSSSGAFSHNGYTVQARRHIFTGSLADVRTGTLIDDFKSNGYETAYFSGQDESFGGAEYGVGFDRADVAYDARDDRDKRYSSFSTAGSLAVPNGVVVERIRHFLERRQPSRPLFLYVNFHDTHFPYHHKDIKPLLGSSPLAQADIEPRAAAALRAMYLNTAANVDRAIGRVLDSVRQHLGHEAAVIVIGDHGESLFDENFLGHGYALNDAQTRIPLVVAGLPLVLTEPVGQSDLRDAIAAALTRPGSDSMPRLDPSPSLEVFQYLGLIDRPAQIKLRGSHSQIAYDFRGDRVQVNGGAWVPSATLTATAATRWRALVEMWERMMIARSGRSGTGS